MFLGKVLFFFVVFSIRLIAEMIIDVTHWISIENQHLELCCPKERPYRLLANIVKDLCGSCEKDSVAAVQIYTDIFQFISTRIDTKRYLFMYKGMEITHVLWKTWKVLTFLIYGLAHHSIFLFCINLFLFLVNHPSDYRRYCSCCFYLRAARLCKIKNFSKQRLWRTHLLRFCWALVTNTKISTLSSLPFPLSMIPLAW